MVVAGFSFGKGDGWAMCLGFGIVVAFEEVLVDPHMVNELVFEGIHVEEMGTVFEVEVVVLVVP